MGVCSLLFLGNGVGVFASSVCQGFKRGRSPDVILFRELGFWLLGVYVGWAASRSGAGSIGVLLVRY